MIYEKVYLLFISNIYKNFDNRSFILYFLIKFSSLFFSLNTYL